MGGLTMRTNNATFVSIYRGLFCVKASKDTPGAISRINKENREVWELHFNELSGSITKIEKEDTDWGLQWKVSVDAEGRTYILNIPYSGGMSYRFFSKLVMCDVSREIVIQIAEKDEKTTFFLRQDGKIIKQYWTRENPRGLPQLDEVLVKGKPTLDDTKQMQYIEKFLQEKVIPRLPKLTPAPVLDGPPDDIEEPSAPAPSRPASNIGKGNKQEPAPTPPTEKLEDLPEWLR